MCEKLTVFPYARYIPLNSMSNALSYDIVRFKIEVGVDAKFICKNVHANFLPYSGPMAGLAVVILDNLGQA